ncbi:MAG: hypothetical protein Rhims3KO_30950 [Hyphomicrobiales bacterium]
MPRVFAPKAVEPIRVTPPKRSQLDMVERWFYFILRAIGLVLIARALIIWFSLTGLLATEQPESSLQLGLVIAAAIASVIAGVGLWLLAAWGAVLWLVLVAVDAVMFFVAPDLAFVRPIVVLLNAGLLALYLGIALMVQRRAREHHRI